MLTQAIMTEKDEIIKFQQEQISLLQEENAMLKERIEALEKRLGLDSTTSSKPPSVEGLNKKSRGQRTSYLPTIKQNGIKTR